MFGLVNIIEKMGLMSRDIGGVVLMVTLTIIGVFLAM